MSLSVITVCIPYLRNALIGFESGKFQTGKFYLQWPGGGGNSRQNKNDIEGSSNIAMIPIVSRHRHNVERERIYAGGNRSNVNAIDEKSTSFVEAATPEELWDNHSQLSQPQGIRTTKEWTVNHESRD